jgi:hypothetical protein
MINDRKLQEQALVRGKLDHLPPPALQRWSENRTSYRFMAYAGKQLLIYKASELGEKVYLDTLTCEGVTYDTSEGLATTWSSSESDTKHTITHRPCEVADSVFLWHTFLTDLQFTPHMGEYTASFSMLCKSAYHPDYLVAGSLYVQEKNKVNFGASK